MGGDRAMRIGIDARFLTHPQEGGFKTYTQSLVHGLAALDRRNDYILYTDRIGAEEAYSRANFRVKAVRGSAPLREQVFLPIAMTRDRVDIAHFLCNTAPLVPPCRSVLTIHDLIPFMPRQEGRSSGGLKSRMLRRYWRAVMPRAARRAHRIITISQSSKADICKTFRAPEEKVTVAPTGLHPEFRPVRDPEELQIVRETYGLPERFILGFVSSDPRKNCRGLIGAAGLAASRLPDIALVLICSSAEARDLALSIAGRQEGPALRLMLLDPVPRRDLAVIYSLADALAFPSLYEGFGLPVIEAMACGTPVVTSNVSSLPEVAGDGALLVDPRDYEAIADALVRIIRDPNLRAELISRGAKRAADFGWKRTARETIAVYEAVFGLSKADDRAQTVGHKMAGGTAE